MREPAEWAMKAAREIVAMRFSVTTKVATIVASGGMDSEEPDIANIARAIEAADKAATERAGSRIAALEASLKAAQGEAGRLHDDLSRHKAMMLEAATVIEQFNRDIRRRVRQ